MTWYPGGKGPTIRNAPVEVAMGVREDGIEFSVCERDMEWNPNDEFNFRMWAYRDWRKGGGHKFVGGYGTVEQAKLAAESFVAPTE